MAACRYEAAEHIPRGRAVCLDGCDRVWLVARETCETCGASPSRRVRLRLVEGGREAWLCDGCEAKPRPIGYVLERGPNSAAVRMSHEGLIAALEAFSRDAGALETASGEGEPK